MGRRIAPFQERRKYTVSQPRSMLKGKSWTAFRLRRIESQSRRGAKAHRLLCINDVFFTAYLHKGDAGPSLRVRAQGQEVVFKFIPAKLYIYLLCDAQSDLRWSHLIDLGPVVGDEHE